MTINHKDITLEAQIHVPKGMSEAAINTIPSKNSSGNLEWIDKDTVSGPQGVPGPPGTIAKLEVVDAALPTELNALSDDDFGETIIVSQVVVGGLDIQTLYVWDVNVTTIPETMPYLVSSSKINGFWVAGSGAYAFSGPISTFTQERFINATEQETVAYSASTGILKPSTISINADTTKIDISDLTGHIVDAYTDPENITVAEVHYAGETALSLDYLLTDTQSFFAIQKGALNPLTGKYDGVVVQSNVEFTTEELKDRIQVGFAIHTAKTVVESVGDTFRSIVNPANSIAALAKAIGTLNKGNVYSLNGANQQLNKSSGSVFSYGANLKNNPKDEHNVPTASVTSILFFTNYQDGIGGFTIGASTNMDTSFWDDGSGTLQAIPNNRYAAFRPFLTVTNQTIMAYPQAHYASAADAIAALESESFEVNPALNEVPQRGGIIFKKGITDFQAAELAGDFQVINGSKFDTSLSGGGASSSTTTQQQAYLNSSPNPEILTDATNGAMTYRRGSALETDDVLEVQNNAGTQTFAVNGEGSVGIGGAASTAVLTVHDNGTALNPIVLIQADDANPWALNIGNTIYSASDTQGLKFSVGNDGDSLIYAADNAITAGKLELGVDNTSKIIIDTTAARFSTQAYTLETALVAGANIATDCVNGNTFSVTLNTVTAELDNPSGLKAGSTYLWKITQDGAGGRLLTFGTAFKFPGGAAPTLSTTAGAVDILTGYSDGSNLYVNMALDFK